MKLKTLASLRKLAVMEAEVYVQFTPYMLEVLCLAAESGDRGISVTEIEQKSKMSKASASKTARSLTARATSTKDGYDLCEWTTEPTNLRMKFLRLNAKGKAFMEAATALFDK